jgi:hypothetical protein
MARTKRIGRTCPTQIVAPDGERSSRSATGIVVALGGRTELTIDYSRHPLSLGGVALLSGLVPRASDAEADESEGREFTAVVLHPGASNAMHATVDHFRGGEPVQPARGSSRRPRTWVLDVRGRRVAVKAKEFVVRLGRGGVIRVQPNARARGVQFEAGPGPTKTEVDRILAGGSFISSDFVVRFGACNVVHMLVTRHRARFCGAGPRRRRARLTPRGAADPRRLAAPTPRPLRARTARSAPPAG